MAGDNEGNAQQYLSEFELSLTIEKLRNTARKVMAEMDAADEEQKLQATQHPGQPQRQRDESGPLTQELKSLRELSRYFVDINNGRSVQDLDHFFDYRDPHEKDEKFVGFRQGRIEILFRWEPRIAKYVCFKVRRLDHPEVTKQ